MFLELLEMLQTIILDSGSHISVQLLWKYKRTLNSFANIVFETLETSKIENVGQCAFRKLARNLNYNVTMIEIARVRFLDLEAIHI